MGEYTMDHATRVLSYPLVRSGGFVFPNESILLFEHRGCSHVKIVGISKFEWVAAGIRASNFPYNQMILVMGDPETAA